MYKVLIGFNVGLRDGEKWPGRTVDAGHKREARCEPGDTLTKLPQLAKADFLLALGAVEVVADEEVSDG